MSVRFQQILALFLAGYLAWPASAGQQTGTSQGPGSQTGVPAPGQAGPTTQPGFPPGTEGEKLRLDYVLDTNDQMQIRVPQAEELNEKIYRVDSEGNLHLPLVGTMRAAGKTVQQFEAELTQQLSAFYRSVRVHVIIVQFRSDPIIFLGAFRNPGIYPLQGKRTLIEMLTSVGGLQPNAARRLRISRRLDWGRIPLSTATEDKERNLSFVDISISRLLETVNPEEDIVLMPYDVVRVGNEEMIYLTGSVNKPGAYPLNDKDSITVLQLLSLAGGLPPDAEPEKARILRPILDTNRRAEVPLNVQAIIAGKANDFPLMPNDVLLIPQSKSVGGTVKRYVAGAAPGLLITALWIALRRN